MFNPGKPVYYVNKYVELRSSTSPTLATRDKRVTSLRDASRVDTVTDRRVTNDFPNGDDERDDPHTSTSSALYYPAL